MMTHLERYSQLLFGKLLAPLDALHPLVALLIVSAITGVAMAIIFRFTSNQRKLAAAADRVHAELLAMKLFPDDLLVVLRCQLALFAAVARRLWHATPPMLVMTLPLVLLLVQLAARYELRPVEPGDTIIVELHVAPEQWPTWRNATPDTPGAPGVTLRDDKQHILYSRVQPEQAGPHTITWQADQKTLTASLAAANVNHLMPLSVHADIDDHRLIINYPKRTTPVLGFNAPWWLTFLIASCLAALLVQPIVKVRF